MAPMKNTRLDSAEFTEQLINLVRERTYIYDPTDKRHKDQVRINQAWMAIAEQLDLNDGKQGKQVKII